MKRIDDFITIGFQCALCGHFEETYEALKKHVLNKHRNQDEKHIDQVISVGYACSQCLIFKTLYPEIKEHVRTMHNELVTNCARHKSAREDHRH